MLEPLAPRPMLGHPEPMPDPEVPERVGVHERCRELNTNSAEALGVTRGPFHWDGKPDVPPVRLGLLSFEPTTGGTPCSLRKPGWNCTCCGATAGRSPPSPGSSGSTGGPRGGTRPRRRRPDTGHGRDRRSSRRPRSPTSSGASRRARTCGRPCSCASSSTSTGTRARTPACAGGSSCSGRPRRHQGTGKDAACAGPACGTRARWRSLRAGLDRRF